MWRPLQTFLYDWWPLARRIRVCKTLRHAHVRVVQGMMATAIMWEDGCAMPLSPDLQPVT